MEFRLLPLLALTICVAGCRPAFPVAAFSVTDTDCSSFCPVRFVNESEGEDLFFVWNFGDGTVISNEVSPMHTYQRGGDYTVTLSASNERGTARDSQTIRVRIFPDSLRITGVQVNALSACTTSPPVRYLLQTAAGDSLARSGSKQMGCADLPASVPVGVSSYGSTASNVFFTLFGAGQTVLFDAWIQPDQIQWEAGTSGEAPLHGIITLKSPSATGSDVTLDMSFLGKYR